jgi:hypothetical protein
MAILSDTERAAVMGSAMTEASSSRTLITLSKTDLRLAINAIDQWVDDNAAAYNAAIPQPARGALTAKQKAELLFFVVRRRWQLS